MPESRQHDIQGEADPAGTPPERQWFTTTSWTAVVTAGQRDSPEAKEALTKLCQTYWEPLHVYLRRLGYNEDDAKDLTQEFFLRLLDKNYLGAANREKGKFRSFLLTALNHVLANERDRAMAAKRGGGKTIVSLEAEAEQGDRSSEPSSDLSPVKVFERRWAMTLFQQAYARLQAEYVAAGKARQFDLLKAFLEAETETGEYSALAPQLQMTPHAVGMAVHRLRQRYGEQVRAEIAHTLVNPTAAEIEEERRHLFETFGP
jgi:RNA polymerase sigma-70 factor (ECF subfamily)